MVFEKESICRRGANYRNLLRERERGVIWILVLPLNIEI